MNSITRVLCATTAIVVASTALGADGKPIVAPAEIAPGPFHPTDDSLKQYQCPDWFRDAKLGFWAHWGPQAVPRQGDWYAKKMYLAGGDTDPKTGKVREADDDYKYHLAHYGHPSQFGYKEIIALWKAERWDPEHLMALYKKAGAKYFVSMGTHHDNFFLWNSKIHRWNAVQMGPKKDIVGIWQKAAQKAGLRFGVSEHLGASYTWFQPSHGADVSGSMAGVPYDGNDPQFQDLYHKKGAPGDKGWLTTDPENQREWFNSVKELLDAYHPDLLYTDSGLPFDDVGRSLMAHFYNASIAKNGGNLEAVYNCKEPSNGRFVRDFERGIVDKISPEPFQTCTSIGDWFYRTGQRYKTGAEIVRILVDVVSKNGNLLINIVQTPEGDLEPDILKTLDEIGAWTAANGEGIYGTRPWKVYGEKPADAPDVKAANFNEEKIKYSARDIRFTAKGEALYAFCLGVPDGEIRIVSLGKASGLAGDIAAIRLLGSAEKPAWKQEADALVIQKPALAPNTMALGYEITFRR